jgi:hypothetical protein
MRAMILVNEVLGLAIGCAWLHIEGGAQPLQAASNP